MGMPEFSRRAFLKLAAGGGGAIAAEMGLKKFGKLIPYITPLKETTPGVWSMLATVCRECPAGCGMHLWHRDGRVTKAEGNPLHPVSAGVLCARGQSALQGLYDPDRLRAVLRRREGQPTAAAQWAEAIDKIANRLRQSPGRAVIISDLQTGALAEVMRQFAAAFGSDRLAFYEPFNYDALREAHGLLFGQPVVPDYRLDECQFVLSLSADFLETWVSNVGLARQFGGMHDFQSGRVGRLAYVGPRLSMTAANSDDYIQVPPGMESRVGLAMLRVMIDRGWARGDVEALRSIVASLGEEGAQLPPDIKPQYIAELAQAFAQAKASVALAGSVGAVGPAARDTAVVAALLNYAAGRIGQTVDFARAHALSHAATEKQAREILSSLTPQDTLIIHNANPAFARPDAAEHIRRAGLVVYMGVLGDETSELAHWVLPVDYPLETWGDYQPSPGVHGLMQPTMARLYDTLACGDVLLQLAAAAGKPLSRPGAAKPSDTFEQWLHERWRELASRLANGQVFEDFWRQALRDGGAWEDTPAGPPVELKPRGEIRLSALPPRPAAETATADLWVYPTVLLFDGRVANRGWIQEAPDPMTYAVWSSWVDIHPRKAHALGAVNGDWLEISTPFSKIEVAARITEEIDETTIAVPLGQGHTAAGLQTARGVGVNAFALLGGDGRRGPFGQVTLRKTTRENDQPIYTSATQEQYNRELLQWADLDHVRQMKPGDGRPLALPLPEGYTKGKDLYPPRVYKAHRWAMVIDLQRCIGCGACAVACYAENNIPVVGATPVKRGREMAWLKVVPYRDDENNHRIGFLPVLCQQCDAAPCEPVCPVFAAVHNEEGLNAQVYNRCIGTRYCSNNCPYKVRRFNWYNVKWDHTDDTALAEATHGPIIPARPPLYWQLNPEVTVRSRGVMEKCTFCIQRIRQAQYQARRENRKVADGEIQPACAQTCPTRAIIFGDLLDDSAEVTRLTRLDPRRYHVLEELNTKPAVTYLQRIRFQQAMRGG